MELNLRKARKLEAKIKTFLDQTNLEHQVAVRIKGDAVEAAAKIQAATDKLAADLDLHTKLNELRFAIRKGIADVNQHVGINALMNQREHLQAKLQLLGKLAESEVAHGANELQDLLKNTATSIEQGTNHYGQSLVHVITSAVTKDVKDSVKSGIASLKKDLEDLEDELAQKNIGAKIIVEDSSVNLLKSAGLL